MKELWVRLAAYCVAGAIALALMFYGLGQLEALFGGKDEATTAASNRRVAAHPVIRRLEDSLEAIEKKGRIRYAALQATAVGLRRQLDSAAADTLDTSSSRPGPDWKAIALGWRAVADTADSAARTCSVVALTCAQRAAKAEAESDSLARQLQAQTKVRDHPCGVSAGVGVLAGWVSTFGGSSGLGTGAGATLDLSCHLFRLPFP